jgi:hypothetical protein
MEGSGTGSVQIITYPDPGGPKTYRSYRSGSITLLYTIIKIPVPLEYSIKILATIQVIGTKNFKFVPLMGYQENQF